MPFKQYEVCIALPNICVQSVETGLHNCGAGIFLVNRFQFNFLSAFVCALHLWNSYFPWLQIIKNCFLWTEIFLRHFPTPPQNAKFIYNIEFFNNYFKVFPSSRSLSLFFSFFHNCVLLLFVKHQFLLFRHKLIWGATLNN